MKSLAEALSIGGGVGGLREYPDSGAKMAQQSVAGSIRPGGSPDVYRVTVIADMAAVKYDDGKVIIISEHLAGSPFEAMSKAGVTARVA